jgi:hypothetical protein
MFVGGGNPNVATQSAGAFNFGRPPPLPAADVIATTNITAPKRTLPSQPTVTPDTAGESSARPIFGVRHPGTQHTLRLVEIGSDKAA